MWETIIGGSVVAGISGLAIIAVKNPDAYTRLHTTLAITSSALMLFYFVANYAGIIYSIGSLEDAFSSNPSKPIHELDFSITNLSTKSNNIKVAFYIFMGFNLYLSALSFLKFIFQKTSDNENQPETTNDN